MTTETIFLVEGWDGDCWDACNVSPGAPITEHETFTAAMAEMDYWQSENRDMTQLRVVEVERDGSRQTVYWPCRY